jgi:hypothetical protein
MTDRLFRRGVAVGLLPRRYVDDRLGELVGVAGALGIGHIFDLSKRNKALSPSIWAVSRDVS